MLSITLIPSIPCDAEELHEMDLSKGIKDLSGKVLSLTLVSY
jgi:hypothetical protein